MTWISASDPLALLALQGSTLTPAVEEAAQGSSELDTKQRAARIGEPVPVVFCRRRNDAGGVLISPPATEARFENSATNEVTAYYHLVLSEGQVDSVQVRDVFQRNCRRGSFSQTYNRRAGTWDPGNVIVPRAGYKVPQAPRYCGTVGTYPDISTLSYQVTAPDESDEWNRQVHIFMRGGLRVTRLFDNVTGPSDNFCDLYRWALRATGKVPDALIDIPSLQKSAAFLERQGFTCNVWSQRSENIGDLSTAWLKHFMLGEANINGKRGLLPLLPTTSQGDFVTDPIVPVYTFDDDLILPGSFEVNYATYSDRQFFCAQIQWRQQPDDDVGLVRTSEVRYADRALTGPYESHDLSEFATSEKHVVRIGAFIISRRYRIDHTAKFDVKPQSHNKSLKKGDIVRVRVRRETVSGGLEYFDWLEQILRITKSSSGMVTYEVEHFPVDATGRSLIVQDVLAAQPTGLVIPNPRTGPSCDTNSATDTSVPAETGRSGSSVEGTGIPVGGGGGGGSGSPGAPGGDIPNPDDGLDTPSTESPLSVYPNTPDNSAAPGSALVMPESPCGPGVKPEFRWLKGNDPIPGRKQNYYVIGTADISTPGLSEPLRGEYRCPGDSKWTTTPPTSPLGLGDTGLIGEVQFYVKINASDGWGFLAPPIFSSQWRTFVPTMQVTQEANPPGAPGTVTFYGDNQEVIGEAPYMYIQPSIEVLAARYRQSPNDPWQDREYNQPFPDPGQPWIQ